WLSQVTHESASVAVLDEAEVVYVARVTARKIMTVNVAVGTRFSVHNTSLGRAILAFSAPEVVEDVIAKTEFVRSTDKTITDVAGLRKELDRVREQGWSLVDSELEYGVRSLAVPLFDAKGSVIGAVNTSTTPGNLSVSQTQEKFLPHLLEAAQRVQRD